ncbi:MAG: TSUP family transporter, partial [Niameybacter sp.]
MYIIYFLICLGASVLGAISGIGGGVIIKPVMDALGTLDVSVISFLSGCTVLSMTIMTLYRNRNSEVKIDKYKGTHLAIGAALGGLLGKQLFDMVKVLSGNANIAGAVQSFLLALVTIGVLLFTLKKAKIRPRQVESGILSLIIGFALGSLSAFLGIGGGPINLAVLYFCF